MSSIADLTGQGPSITDPSQALHFFSNRSALIRHFAGYLNGDPARNQILFLHSEGGNGKTLLLRYLEKNCCKRLTPVDWIRSRGLSDDDFREFLKSCNVFDPVAKAMLDFSAQPTVEQNPKDPFSGLLLLRGQLAKAGIPFPLFDFACTWYVHKTRRLTLERLQQLIPTEGLTVILGVAKALIDPTSVIDLAQVLLDSVDRHLQGRFSQYMQARNLSRSDVQMILEMDYNKDLVNLMPVFFAQDLNAAMQIDGTPRRVVLLVDGHDALWRTKDAAAASDTWLRTLLTRLHLNSGIVVVISGREKPRWTFEEGAVEPYIPAQFVDAKPLGGLKSADARHYLHLAGVADDAVKAQLIHMAESGPDQVHPLLLGLLVDVYRLAKSEFRLELGAVQTKVQDKIRLVLERLQSYASDEIRNGIQALSACRTFDFPLHQYLGKKLAFTATQASFDTLVQFSFVSEVGGNGSKRYRVHELLRRLLRESQAEFHRKADPVLEEYYRTEMSGAGDAAAVEAIYHASRWDGERAVREWVASMENALRLSRHDLCRLLVDVRSLLEVGPRWQGTMSRLSGQYYMTMSQYGEAELEFQRAVVARDPDLAAAPENVGARNSKANALKSLGDLYASLSQYPEARESYLSAIAAYDLIIAGVPADSLEYGLAHGNKGIVLRSLGGLYTRLSHYNEARESYLAAIAAFDLALARAPRHSIYNNKGNAERDLGGLCSRLSLYPEAMESYRSAIASYDQALAKSPEYVYAHNNKAIALKNLGNVYAKLSRYGKALEIYQSAIAAYDQALGLAPQSISAHINKGNVLVNLGELHAKLSHHTQAMESYQSAVSAFDRVLAIAPKYLIALNDKGNALSRLGLQYSTLERHTEAMESYRAAVATYDRVLSLAPDSVKTHSNRGTALRHLGDLQAKLSQNDKALESYGCATASYDQALALAPHYVLALNNKGSTLGRLGAFYVKLSQYTQATESYRTAIATYDLALAKAPDEVSTHSNKGVALKGLADLYSRLARDAEAMETYRRAITAQEQALRRAPQHVSALNNKGNALRSMGDLCFRLSQNNEAMASYRSAIDAYDQALVQAPEDPGVHNNKGMTLKSLGDLYSRQSQPTEAIASCRSAVAAYDQTLALAPQSVNALINKGGTLKALGDLHAKLTQNTEALECYCSAILACDQSLALAPDAPSGLTNRGKARRALGLLYARLLQFTEAIESYRSAVADFDSVLESAPEDPRVHVHKGRALSHLANLYANLSRQAEALEGFRGAIAAFDRALAIAPDLRQAQGARNRAVERLNRLSREPE